MVKTSQYYYINYQFIIKESNENQIMEKIFYSRTNRLKFKLCHDYCETCYELGISENNQKCLLCLPDYQYDYDYAFEYILNIINCVPEGYYYDNELNYLMLCNSTKNIIYIDLDNNKIICYKELYDNIETSNILYEEMREKEIFLYENENKNSFEEEESKTQIKYESLIFEKEEENEEFQNNEEKINYIEEIYNNIKNELMNNYNKTEDNYLKLSTNNNYSFQLTTVNNKIDSLSRNLKTNFSVIDFRECTKKLNKENGCEEDADLILLKYENENQIDLNQKSIQYEIYKPHSNNKLDLSVCSDVKIDIYIPIQLSEDTQKLYEDLISQGYNLFDKNDKFYTDICIPFKTKDGTDIILSDRFNNFFIPNQLNCQANCEYSNYLPDSQYLKCECNVIDEEKIETKNHKK